MLSPRTPPTVTAGSELPPLAVPITSPRPDEDAELVDGLKCRDEAAFVTLLERYQGQLLRLALVYCRTEDIAEEIVQDTWLAVIQGIDRFEGRATFKTWLFQILVNRARTRAVKEGRSLSFSPPCRPRDSALPMILGPTTGRCRHIRGVNRRTRGCSQRRR